MWSFGSSNQPPTVYDITWLMNQTVSAHTKNNVIKCNIFPLSNKSYNKRLLYHPVNNIISTRTGSKYSTIHLQNQWWYTLKVHMCFTARTRQPKLHLYAIQSTLRTNTFNDYISMIYGGTVNTLRPKHNGRHFADDRLKCIFVNEYILI